MTVTREGVADQERIDSLEHRLREARVDLLDLRAAVAAFVRATDLKDAEQIADTFVTLRRELWAGPRARR